MTAITDITKVWNILYVDKGARIRNGLSIGIDYASNPGTWANMIHALSWGSLQNLKCILAQILTESWHQTLHHLIKRHHLI